MSLVKQGQNIIKLPCRYHPQVQQTHGRRRFLLDIKLGTKQIKYPDHFFDVATVNA